PVPAERSDSMFPLRTILHATDFSPYSQYAFNLACALARDYRARLLVVHVKVAPTMLVGEFGAVPAVGENDDAVRHELLALRPPSGVSAEHILADGPPAAEIIRVAKENGCDLIVLGSHGRTGLARLLMGSVAETVVRKASCPVLVVKGPVPATASEVQAATAPAAV